MVFFHLCLFILPYLSNYRTESVCCLEKAQPVQSCLILNYQNLHIFYVDMHVRLEDFGIHIFLERDFLLDSIPDGAGHDLCLKLAEADASRSGDLNANFST